jgi:hypothetical protein
MSVGLLIRRSRHALRLVPPAILDASTEGEEIPSFPNRIFSWDVFLADTGRVSIDDFKPSNSCISGFISYGSTKHLLSEQDVVAFVNWVSSHDEKRWRLPSESELEWIESRAASMYPKDYSKPAHPNPDVELGATCCGEFVSEVVQDCWHEAFSGAPTDSSAWTTGCSQQAKTVLCIDNYRSVGRAKGLFLDGGGGCTQFHSGAPTTLSGCEYLGGPKGAISFGPRGLNVMSANRRCTLTI